MAKVSGSVGQLQLMFMKENMLMIKNVVLVYLHGPLEIHIKVIILMIYVMAMEICIGWMALIIKDYGVKIIYFIINK